MIEDVGVWDCEEIGWYDVKNMEYGIGFIANRRIWGVRDVAECREKKQDRRRGRSVGWIWIKVVGLTGNGFLWLGAGWLL